MEIKKPELVSDELDEDDDIDELFGWAGAVYDSKEPDYTVTLQNGTITSVSDGAATVTLS